MTENRIGRLLIECAEESFNFVETFQTEDSGGHGCVTAVELKRSISDRIRSLYGSSLVVDRIEWKGYAIPSRIKLKDLGIHDGDVVKVFLGDSGGIHDVKGTEWRRLSDDLSCSTVETVSPGGFKCKYCARAFTSKRSLGSHVGQHKRKGEM